MRVIARSTLARFAATHPQSEAALVRWYAIAKAAHWKTTAEVQATFPKAKVLNAERVRFEVAGGNFRLIVFFKFAAGTAHIVFLGTHKDYDAIDPFTVWNF